MRFPNQSQTIRFLIPIVLLIFGLICTATYFAVSYAFVFGQFYGIFLCICSKFETFPVELFYQNRVKNGKKRPVARYPGVVQE